MKDYTFIESIEPQEDGISNVFIRGNKRAVIEIKKLEDRFRAEIYHIYNGNPKEPKVIPKRKSLLKKIEHNNSNDVLTNALGWIDENHGDIPDVTEIYTKDLEK